jgi:NAD(P)-dependent dehydrogenase (short-subunit alcohol dehydrogenase family)
VVGLTKGAALEYGPHKIRVNAVGPGFIKTPIIENTLTPDAIKALAGLHPLGRIGEPSEVAELVTWLSSDKASFVSGGYYAVDGGYLRNNGNTGLVPAFRRRASSGAVAPEGRS